MVENRTNGREEAKMIGKESKKKRIKWREWQGER